MGLPDIPLNAGNIGGLTPDTLYYVYYNDPGFQGDANGPVQYIASNVKELALIDPGFLFVGSIRTPVAGGPPTIGNNDGGAGAQVGMANKLYFSRNQDIN